jgi:Fe2+ or Zn2+ uptake regulation protein
MTDADRLRAAGLRVTSARLAILETVRTGHHPGTDEIARAARERVDHLTVQAVYEALNALTGAGLVRRIEFAGGPARYGSRVGDNHHHAVCRGCGTVTDVDCAVGHAPCLEPARNAGYTIDEAEVTFWGLCASCQAAGRRPDEWQHGHPGLRAGRPGRVSGS